LIGLLYGGIMKRFLGGMVSMLCLCLALAATVHGRSPNTVYLKDGGRIECQNYWQRDGRVFVLVNRDVQIELSPDEVDIKKTFSKKPVVPVRKVKAASPEVTEAKTADARTTPTPQATVSESVTEKPKVTPAAKPAAAPQPPAPPSVAKPVSPPVQQPPAAKATAVPVPAPERATLTQVEVKKVSPFAGVMPGMGTLLLVLLIVLILIASLWTVFTKAGEAGWQCLIPLWNMFVLVKISGKPWWWFLLLFVPVVNLIVYILVFIALAERFNKGALFGLGLFFLGFIFFPILAFGSSTYE
jgi:hypothetical protein